MYLKAIKNYFPHRQTSGFKSPSGAKDNFMKKFKKKLKIERATAFKLEYSDDEVCLKTKEFNSYKAMEQFHSRQKDFLYIDHHRYALIDGVWHRFIKLNSPFIFEPNLYAINKDFEDYNLQKQKNEDV